MCENPSSRACSEDTKTVRFIAITTCSGGGWMIWVVWVLGSKLWGYSESNVEKELWCPWRNKMIQPLKEFISLHCL